MTKRYSVLAVIFAAALAFAAAAPAAPRVQVVPVSQGTRLLVGGKLIALFRTPNGSLSPQARAEYAARRLTELVGKGLRAEDIDVRSKGDAWAVFTASNGRARLRSVTLGHRNDQEAEVLGGLEADTPVIVHPSDQIRDGRAVTARIR